MILSGISLFSNAGIAELYLKKLGIDIVLANEILKNRVKFYMSNICVIITFNVFYQIFTDIIIAF